MTELIGTSLIGGSGGGSGGAVDSFNGRTGAVVPVAGDYDATQIASTGPSTVQIDLDLLAGQIAGLVVIDSFAKLEATFPAALGVHTVNQQTLWVSQTGAPIGLPPGNSISVVNPGSITAVGASKVLIFGDVAGPLLSGEIIAEGIAALNINPGGSDFLLESLGGRAVALLNTTSLGQAAGVVQNCLGVALINLAQQPSAPGATGMVIDGSNAVQLWDSVATAPGGAPYVAWSVAATATILVDLRFAGWAFFGSGFAGEAAMYIDPLATLPTGPLPTSIVGFEAFGGSAKLAPMFAAGSLDETDIRILSSQNTGGPTSQFIGDVAADTQATAAPVEIEQVYVASNAWEVVPSDNAPAVAPNDVQLALNTALSQRHTLVIDARQDWHLRYDGPENALVRAVSWRATLERQGGSAQAVDIQLEADFGGGWVPLDDTRDTVVLTATLQSASGRTVIPEANSGFSLRLVSRTTNNTVNTYWGKLQVSIGF